MSRSAEVELVDYRVDDLTHATTKLIYSFAEYSGILGTRKWVKMSLDLIELIKSQTPFYCIWEAVGMDVSLSFFGDLMPLIKESEILYVSPEPTILFIERPDTVLPPVWTHVNRVTNAIALEMQDVYRMRVENDPLRLIFPKEEYAKKIDHFTVPILSSQ